MGIFLCLIVQVAAGVVLLVLPRETWGLLGAPATPALSFWLGAITSFAIPGAIALLAFTRGIFIKICAMLWGIWTTAASAWLLVRIGTYAPTSTDLGKGLVGVVFVFSLALVLFCLFALSPKRSKRVTA